MAKNDRYVVKHEDGWAVKKPGAERASSVQDTQREAERQAKETVSNLGAGRFASRAGTGSGGIPTPCPRETIRARRATASTECWRSPPAALRRAAGSTPFDGRYEKFTKMEFNHVLP
jgi:hypothetical protein